MANTFTRTRPAAVVARTFIPLGTLAARFSDWNDARRTRAALSRLSAHQLDDIGLERSDIDQLAARRY